MDCAACNTVGTYLARKIWEPVVLYTIQYTFKIKSFWFVRTYNERLLFIAKSKFDSAMSWTAMGQWKTQILNEFTKVRILIVLYSNMRKCKNAWISRIWSHLRNWKYKAQSGDKSHDTVLLRDSTGEILHLSELIFDLVCTVYIYDKVIQ